MQIDVAGDDVETLLDRVFDDLLGLELVCERSLRAVAGLPNLIRPGS